MSQDNFNYENRFSVIFSSEEYHDLSKNAVEVNLPDITIGNTIQPTPIRPIYIPGDSLDISEIQMSFLLDEDYANYKKFFNWLNLMRDFDETLLDRVVTDIQVVILNGKYNPFMAVDMKDCYPFALSGIPLSHQINDLDPIKFTVNFKINGIGIS